MLYRDQDIGKVQKLLRGPAVKNDEGLNYKGTWTGWMTCRAIRDEEGVDGGSSSRDILGRTRARLTTGRA